MEKNLCSHSHIYWQLSLTQFKLTMRIRTKQIILKELCQRWWRYWTRIMRLRMETNISFWHRLSLELFSFSNKCMSKLICFSLERWISNSDMSVKKRIIHSLNNHIFTWLYFTKLLKTTAHLNSCGNNSWKFIKESMEIENGIWPQIIRTSALVNLLKEKLKEQLKAS